MARKKSGPKRSANQGGDSPKPRKQSSRPPKARVPTWHEVEVAMWQMLGHDGPPDDGPDSPRAKAAALLSRAFEAPTRSRAVKLAQEALAAWPDFSEAHLFLADCASGPKAALDQYTLAVEAGRRALGEKAFKLGVGHFWGLLPTRGYMRALYGRARVLWILGRREEAVADYRELLRLNPGDNQGVRYVLATALIELDRDAELEKLLKQYPGDIAAYWPYSAALLAFRKEGDTARSREVLKKAVAANPFVPEYLTGREPLPSPAPETVGVGDESEAGDYTVSAMYGWRSTPGALDWLRQQTAPARSRSRRGAGSKTFKGPTPATKTRRRKLPTTDEVWQLGARRLPVWITEGDAPHRPWLIVVASVTHDLVLGQLVVEAEPQMEACWDLLSKAMRDPAVGPPRRPAVLEVSPGEETDRLAEHVESIGVQVERVETLGLIEQLLDEVIEEISGRPATPGLLEMPGVTQESVRSFYEAAAGFYRDAPWRRFGGNETVRVNCDRFESGPWFAVIFGQMGMTLGLALYDELKALRGIRDSQASDEENARNTVALSMTFGTVDETTMADVDSVEELDLEVAAPDAYPSPVRKERGLMMRPPLGWELNLLEASMRALPKFIDTHDRDDVTPETVEVETGGGPLRLEMAWVLEDLDD